MLKTKALKKMHFQKIILGKTVKKKNGQVSGDNFKKLILISWNAESFKIEKTAEEIFKDSKICHISDLLSSTMNNDIVLEIVSLKDNTLYLDYFFLNKDNLDERTNGESINDEVQ